MPGDRRHLFTPTTWKRNSSNCSRTAQNLEPRRAVWRCLIHKDSNDIHWLSLITGLVNFMLNFSRKWSAICPLRFTGLEVKCWKKSGLSMQWNSNRGETTEVSFLPPVIPFNVALLIPHPMRRIMIMLYFAGIRFRKYLNLGNFNPWILHGMIRKGRINHIYLFWR